MVCQEFVEEAMLLGIKIDVVLCEIGQQEFYKMKVEHQLPVKFVTYNSLADPVSVGIKHLIDLSYPAVHILADVNDQLLDQLSQFENINITTSDGFVRWLYCHKGVFKKWISKGAVLLQEKGNNFTMNSTGKTTEEDYSGFRKIEIHEEGMVELRQEKPFWLGEYIY
ncbi:hypothetical protein C900_02787 [Fulvivirga imtechensis AK7]|uniref:Uncharacterized protein n=2 Tax=Fulvivirga TaxID=396811 RepID=L8JR45_9BACT|nr:hypothetical protein C900_02787 [Fulvivirga imtechensis AK7]